MSNSVPIGAALEFRFIATELEIKDLLITTMENNFMATHLQLGALKAIPSRDICTENTAVCGGKCFSVCINCGPPAFCMCYADGYTGTTGEVYADARCLTFEGDDEEANMVDTPHHTPREL